MASGDTKDILQGLCSSAAVQTCQTYDLSLSYIERYILQKGILRGQVFYLQRYLARRIGFRRELVVSSRPTIRRIISSVVSSLDGRVATY